MRRLLVAGFLVCSAFAPFSLAQSFNLWGEGQPPPIVPPQVEGSGDLVVLHGFDKITARVSELRVPINQPVRFGTLDIVARFCAKRPPEEPPEVTAFLEIDDIQGGDKAKRIFTGWMFASSPSLSALEHAVYDVWVINCITSAPDVSVGNE